MIRHSLKVVFLAIIVLSFITPYSETTALTLTSDDVYFEIINEDRSTEVSNIRDYKSAITLLEVFSPECDHCWNQLPALEELRAQFTLSELTMISLSIYPETYSVDYIADYRDSYRDSKDSVEGITWFMGRDMISLWERFEVNGVPTFLWFHSNGTVQFSKTEGYRTFSTLFNKVSESLTLYEEGALENYTSTPTSAFSDLSATPLLFTIGVVLVPLFIRKYRS
ncbi:MAG: hypothetical protein ACTSYA_00105 [Candidatus Kariarchaeaceae archaeon]